MTAIETKGKLIIREANELVMARYKLTRTAQRLLLLLLSKIKREDEKFHRYELNLKKTYKILYRGKESLETKKKRLEQGLNILQTNILKIPGRNADGEFLKMTAWIEAPTIEWDKGTMSVRLAEHLKTFLLGLKEDFTDYPYKEALQFWSGYGFRLYKMCLNFYPRADFNSGVENGHYVRREKLSLQRFREMLEVSPERHKRMYDFRRKVIEKAQKEIHKRTIYRFDYDLKRTGRRYTHIELCFKGEPVVALEKKPKSKPPGENAILKKDLLERGVPRETIDNLKKLGVSMGCVRKAFAEYSIEQVREAVQVAKEEDEKNGLRHSDGFLKKALEEGWQSQRTGKLERKKRFEKAKKAEEAEEKLQTELAEKEEKRRAEQAKREEEQYAAADNEERFEYVLKNLSGFKESYNALSSEAQDRLREYAYDVFDGFHNYGITYRYILRELREYQ